MSPQSTADRSSLTNPLPGLEADGSVQLAELIIEDSEDDDGNDAQAHASRNRSTSTLDAVKARIRRHLSQDSISCLSESEEQMTRRAEVKRLMRKRIREELQNEANPLFSRMSTPQHPVVPSAVPVSVTGNGPRDTIEFTVDEVTRDKQLAKAETAHLPKASESEGQNISASLPKRRSNRSTDKENQHSDRRCVSLRDWIEHDLKAAQADHHRHVRQRSSLPEIPASPRLQPAHVASLHGARSLTSWRLSLGTDKLVDLLTPDRRASIFQPVATPVDNHDTLDARLEDHEPLRRVRGRSSPLVIRTTETTADELSPSQASPDFDYPCGHIPKSSSLVRDESPVGLWLRAQSQQFHLSTASLAQSEHQSDNKSVSHERGTPADRPCAVNALHPQLDSFIFSPVSRRAASPTHSVRVDAVYASSSERNAALHDPRKHASAEVPLPAMSHEASEIPLDADAPFKSTVRRGFAGIKLPSFRCEFMC